MNEESVIFGAKRHLYGGIQPSNMREFSVVRQNSSLTMTLQLPEDTVIDGFVICNVKGAWIRRKVDEYPKNEFDGELVLDFTSPGKQTIKLDDDGVNYFYRAFPYSDANVVNRNIKNGTTTAEVTRYHFGYRVKLNDPNPETRVEYLENNKNFTPVSCEISEDTVGDLECGDWQLEAGAYFMPRPVLVDSKTSTILHYLNPNDYTKTIDGIDVSDLINGSISYYDVLLEWPKIYVYREKTSTYYTFKCASYKVNRYYECWSNYDVDDQEIPCFYTGAYPASIKSSIPYSLSGQGDVGVGSVYSALDYSFRKGRDYTPLPLSDMLLITDLLTMLFKTTRLDNETLGYPMSVMSDRPTGMSDSSGFFTLAPSHYSQHVSRIKLFGMEWAYGNYVSVGCFLFKGELYYKLTRGVRDGSTNRDYIDLQNGRFNSVHSSDMKPDGYLKVSKLRYTIPEDRTSLTKLYTDIIGNDYKAFFPTDTNDGSTSTYWCARVSSGASVAQMSEDYTGTYIHLRECDPSNFNNWSMSGVDGSNSSARKFILSWKPARGSVNYS